MTVDELFQRGLNLEKLRSFLEVAQSGSVTKAARGGESRRSLMSRQIGELEKTLGFDLFRRNGRAIEITEAGRELALLTASFFAEFEEVARRGNKAETVLRIGAGASVFEALVFPRLHRLEKEFSGSNFEFLSLPTAQVIDDLHNGKIDIGIVRSNLNFPGIAEIPAGNIRFVLVGRRDFDTKLAGWPARTFLSRVPISIISGEGSWVESFRRLCLEMEITPRVTHRVQSFGHVRELLKASAPGGILPEQLAAELPVSQFAVIEDDALAPLARSLSVAFDSRAGRVRDRLEGMAAALAKVIS